MEALEQSENEFEKQIDLEMRKEATKPTKRQRKGNSKYSSQDHASDRQVSVALGEKPKLTHAQFKSKKDSKDKAKAVKIGQKSASSALDATIISTVQRSLFSEPHSASATTLQSPASSQRNKEVLQSVPSAAEGRSQSETHSAIASENPTPRDENFNITGNQNLGDIFGQKFMESDVKSADAQSCFCRELRDNANPATRKFVGVLAKMLEVPTTPGLLSERPTQVHSTYLKPLPLSPGAKKVELTQGSGIFIDLKRKNEIKAMASDNPDKMLAEVMLEMFGKEVFQKNERITARGTRQGTKGFEENVLLAILGFINRNCPPAKKMKLTEMNRIINRKSGDWRRYAQNKLASRSPHKKSTSVITEASTPVKSPSESPIQSFTNASGIWITTPKKDTGASQSDNFAVTETQQGAVASREGKTPDAADKSSVACVQSGNSTLTQSQKAQGSSSSASLRNTTLQVVQSSVSQSTPVYQHHQQFQMNVPIPQPPAMPQHQHHTANYDLAQSYSGHTAPVYHAPPPPPYNNFYQQYPFHHSHGYPGQYPSYNPAYNSSSYPSNPDGQMTPQEGTVQGDSSVHPNLTTL